MSPATPNLWGDLSLTPTTNAPAKVLREQAHLFNRRLDGLLAAEVKVLVNSHEGIQTSEFLIRAPLLNDFVLSLFTCEHVVTAPYPVRVIGAKGLWEGEAVREAGDETALAALLGGIFASAFVRKAIDGLITTSKGLG